MSDHCWMWDGSYYRNGYGQASPNRLAHRVAYEHLVGPIEEGKDIDHLCRVRGCVNPAHLRVVTRRENLLADGSLCRAKVNAEKTKCVRGHSFDLVNTYYDRGFRQCRICSRTKSRLFRAKLRTSVRGASPIRDAVCSSGAVDAATAGSAPRQLNT